MRCVQCHHLRPLSEENSPFLFLHLPLAFFCRNERVWFQLGSQGCVRLFSLSCDLYVHIACQSVSRSPVVDGDYIPSAHLSLLYLQSRLWCHSFLVFPSFCLFVRAGWQLCYMVTSRRPLGTHEPSTLRGSPKETKSGQAYWESGSQKGKKPSPSKSFHVLLPLNSTQLTFFL